MKIKNCTGIERECTDIGYISYSEDKLIKSILFNYFTMLPENDIKEGISKAYVKTICNSAGYSLSIDEKDFGDDITIKEIECRSTGKTCPSGHCVAVQIKCTTINHIREDGNFLTYDLRNKNYNDLINNVNTATKKILIVLILPTDKREWVSQDIESLIIKKCAYWIYLGGRNSVADNNNTTAIKIPKENIFSEESINEIIRKIKSKEDLNE